MGSRRAAGFTLIEVAVALTILGWVMGSALYLVQQYADERVRLRRAVLLGTGVLESSCGALSRCREVD